MRRVRRRFIIIPAAITLIVVVVFSIYWLQDQPRRNALQAIARLANILVSHQSSELLEAVVMPTVIRSRTQAEQQEFIAKALADEISPEGVLALKHRAQFGPAKSIFPAEYAEWCRQAGVAADDCVAFKMERAGIQAEIVLVHEGETYRVVRCKDVKQMAGGNQI
jgi:hypothetical protein